MKTIIEMVHGTRLDTALGSAGLIRQGLVQVIEFLIIRKRSRENIVHRPFFLPFFPIENMSSVQ